MAARAARAVEALRQAAPRPEPPVSIAVSRLAPGARVRVTSIGQTGELLRLAGNLAEVQLERMRVTVPVSDLASAVPDGEPAPNLVRGRIESLAFVGEFYEAEMRVGDALLLARTEPEVALHVGDGVHFVLDPAHCLLLWQ